MLMQRIPIRAEIKSPISQHYLPLFIYKARFSFLVTTDFEDTELK